MYKVVGLLDQFLFVLVFFFLLFSFVFPLTSASKWFQRVALARVYYSCCQKDKDMADF